jgi:hypothetical protein
MARFESRSRLRTPWRIIASTASSRTLAGDFRVVKVTCSLKVVPGDLNGMLDKML